MQSTSNLPFHRPGGRMPFQLRLLTLTPGFVQTAEGSVLVSLGNTRVFIADNQLLYPPVVGS
jgi:ribonuclease PH